MFLTKKKVLVTGGAGFIGSWLCDVLIDFGAEVTALDDLSTGRMKNIDHLIKRIQISNLSNQTSANFKAQKNLILSFTWQDMHHPTNTKPTQSKHSKQAH